MYLSVFDLFKIGIGPSSSHTVGPMRAARRFLEGLSPAMLLTIARVSVTLYGSLAHTGKGHGTDGAVCLGLMGEVADEVDVDTIQSKLQALRHYESLLALGQYPIHFVCERDIVFNRSETLPGHPNAMRFEAFAPDGARMASRIFYSVGGGFVVDTAELGAGSPEQEIGVVPYPFRSMADLLRTAPREGLRLADLLWRNEEALRPRNEIDRFLDTVIEAMSACIDRGLAAEGTLPGALRVPRRAKALAASLEGGRPHAFPEPGIAWLNAYAIAVNEENAAGGRVVTAPTNGAAGVVPAVLRYYLNFRGGTRKGAHEFLIVASAIGALCKMNASISGAEVGCQGEVGTAAAMAAAGLASALGATNAQVENAAEIALEHHLGMTCDPIGGLVQIPCIERNAMGAMKAVNATALAMSSAGEHMVSLDSAIETMKRTGADMQTKYKETSLGGLAIARVNC